MKSNGDTVEFTDQEKEVVEIRDAFLKENVSEVNAARYALSTMHRPSRAFVKHLSHGALTTAEGKVIEVESSTAGGPAESGSTEGDAVSA